MEPDIAGFRAAQEALIDKLGQDVTFTIPGVPTYPPGTELDPQTGRPYDPTIRPVTDPSTNVTIRCAVVYRPIRGRGQQGDVDEGASGMRRTGGMALTCKVADKPSIEDATSASVNGIDYRVDDIVPDGLTEVQRYVIFLVAR